MNCNETFNAGVCYVTDAYKTVCRFNEELHADLEKYRAENAKLRELAVRMFHTIEWSDRMSDSMHWPSFSYERELRELGVEVDG